MPVYFTSNNLKTKFRVVVIVLGDEVDNRGLYYKYSSWHHWHNVWAHVQVDLAATTKIYRADVEQRDSRQGVRFLRVTCDAQFKYGHNILSTVNLPGISKLCDNWAMHLSSSSNWLCKSSGSARSDFVDALVGGGGAATDDDVITACLRGIGGGGVGSGTAVGVNLEEKERI